MKVSIIIPAYNEEKRISATLEEYASFFEKIKGLDYEIIVVINNTKDRTENKVREVMKINKRVLYINLKKGGKGYAVKEGFKFSLKRDSELIGFVDADLATSPQEFYKLIKNMRRKDGAIANRYLKGSKVTPLFSFRRQVMARIFNLGVRTMFSIPYTDTQCGAKLFRKEVIQKIMPELVIGGWAFDVNLLFLCKKYGYRIKEVPTVWYERGGSKVNLITTSLSMISEVFRIWIKLRFTS